MKLSFAPSMIVAALLGSKASVKAELAPNGVRVDGSWRNTHEPWASLPEGYFFSLDGADWIKYFGSYTYPETKTVKQCRNNVGIWTGEILVWDGRGGRGTHHGRRNPESTAAGGQWNKDDYIVKPEEACSLTQAPTLSPTTTPGWVINYRSMSADFSSINNSTTGELTMSYDISSTRFYEHTLLKKDCTTPIGGNVITNSTASTSPHRNGTSLLLIKHDINKTAVASSSIWNSTSNSIEVCEVVSLIIPATGSEEKMIISQVERVSAVVFDMKANFTVVNDLQDGAAGTDSQSTNLDDYVKACKCDDAVPFACNTDPLRPNEQLEVCVKSNSADVLIRAITSMIINQGSERALSVIEGSEIKYASFSSMSEVASELGYKVSVLLPINIFDFAGPNITVAGSLEMQLGSRRRLRNSRVLADAEAVPFQLEIALSDKEDVTKIMDTAEGASDAAPGYLVPLLAAVGSVSLLAMAGMAVAFRKRRGNAVA